MSNMRILAGMIRHEFRLQWRRRGLLIVLLSLALIVAIPGLIGTDSMASAIESAQAGSEADAPDMSQAVGWTVAMFSWVVVAALLAFMLPLAVADTVALDRQRGVDELLGTLPVHPALYLCGKVAGMVVAAVAGLLVLMVVFAVMWVAVNGMFDMRLYFESWLFGATALVIINGGLGVLIGATQPNRRRAVLLVMAVLVVTAAFLNMVPGEGNLFDHLNPWRAHLFMVLLPLGESAPTTMLTTDVLLTFGVGLVQLAVIGAGVYWLRERQR